jgi:hypothetical protein
LGKIITPEARGIRNQFANTRLEMVGREAFEAGKTKLGAVMFWKSCPLEFLPAQGTVKSRRLNDLQKPTS